MRKTTIHLDGEATVLISQVMVDTEIVHLAPGDHLDVTGADANIVIYAKRQAHTRHERHEEAHTGDSLEVGHSAHTAH